jgi:hypothetical protein
MTSQTTTKPKKSPLPKAISEAIQNLQTQVDSLQQLAKRHAPKLNFTLDGRLVGDLGELLSAMKLGITIENQQRTGFDGVDQQGRNVEIKTTFQNSFAFRKIAERVICIKLHGSTHWEIIYDGDGKRLIEKFPKDAFRGAPIITQEEPASLKSQRQLSIDKLRALA